MAGRASATAPGEEAPTLPPPSAYDEPWIVLAIAVMGSIVLLILRRLAFWVPLVGGVLLVVAIFVGAGLATAGVPTA